MGHSLTAMLEEYREKLLKRRKYLKDRIHFLNTLPKKSFGHVFPNTFSYNETFKEMDDIDDVLSDISEFLDRYISDVCCVCGETIGYDLYERHHISYYPEITILVHRECHYSIHHTNSYPDLKPLVGDSRDFYNGIKKPDNWIESGIPGHELKAVHSSLASCYPRPNLNWNRAAITEIYKEYEIIYRKVTKPRT